MTALTEMVIRAPTFQSRSIISRGAVCFEAGQIMSMRRVLISRPRCTISQAAAFSNFSSDRLGEHKGSEGWPKRR